MGFGNLNFSHLLSVPLTTVEQFPYKIGERAVNILLKMISEEWDEKLNIEIPTEIIERRSVI